MKYATLTAILLLMVTTLSAQPPRTGERGSRGAMHTMQCEQIINILELEESKQQTFRDIYNAYNSASRSLHTPPQKRERDEKPSEEQVEAMILNSFDMSIKSMEIKREYYTKFREILTPSQISKMYRIERNIRDRAIKELQQRGRNGGGIR